MLLQIPIGQSRMTRETFWTLIEKARPRNNNAAQHTENLTRILKRMSPAEIVSFERHRMKVEDSAYRAQLWNVIYIVFGGCSDDAFSDFRNWLILQGKLVYTRVLRRPRRIADFDPKTSDYFNEELSYVALRAYAEKTGNEFPFHLFETPLPTLRGKLLDAEGMKRKYPDLWERFIEGKESKRAQ